jgi:hypothetical protein
LPGSQGGVDQVDERLRLGIDVAVAPGGGQGRGQRAGLQEAAGAAPLDLRAGVVDTFRLNCFASADLTRWQVLLFRFESAL